MSETSKTQEEIYQTTIMRNIRRKSKYTDQVQMVDGIPLFSWVDINPTELCNRKCVFCPRSDPKVYPNQNFHMKVELAHKIAEELRGYDYQGGVIFSGFGEPMLHREFTKLVAAFGQDIHTELVTNGDRLTEKSINDLYEAGLGIILVSMYDGPEQIDKFHALFKRAGISEDRYTLRDRWYDKDKNYGLKLTNRAGTVTSGNQELVDQHRPCFYTHYSMQVNWNGEILLCVQDWNKKVKFGDLNSQSLMEIWTSKPFTEYRAKLGRGSRSLSPCSSCNVNGTLHGFNHAESWNKIYIEKKIYTDS